MGNDKIKDLLLKLKALADQGIEGEKDNAESLLKKMLTKYGMQMEDITSDFVEERRFAGVFEKDQWLFLQICGKVMSISTTNSTRKHKRYGELWMDCTPSQFIEIRAMFTFYLRAFKKEEEILRTAFITRHQLWNEKHEGTDWDSLSKEEQEKIKKACLMSHGLSEVGYYKQLES